MIQIFPKELQLVELANLQLADQRKYGSTLVCFYTTKDQAGSRKLLLTVKLPIALSPIIGYNGSRQIRNGTGV